MFILNSASKAVFEAKGSKFLAFLEPFSHTSSIKERQEALRSEHPKAVHVVYACRFFNEFHQIVENQSDDGEPKGSSAAPMLNVLRGAGLINVACFVVRYFGGTLLGVGGLVRAYSNSANLSIEEAKTSGFLAPFIRKNTFTIELSYSDVNKLCYLLDSNDIVYEKFFSDKVIFKLDLSEEEKSLLTPSLEKLRLELKNTL